MVKNAIFFMVLGPSMGLDWAKEFFRSLAPNVNSANTDLLIVVDKKWSKDLKSYISLNPVQFNCQYHEMDTENYSMNDICLEKYVLFNSFNLDQYDKVLYLDTDIIISSPLDKVFEIKMDTPIYSYNDGYMGFCKIRDTYDKDYYGLSYLIKNNLLDKYGDRNIFSAGVMLINVKSVVSKKAFNSLVDFAKKNIRNNGYSNFYDSDQPAAIILFNIMNVINPNGLNNMVVNNPDAFVLDMPPIAHFPGGVGASNKLDKMLNFVNLIPNNM